MLGEHNLKHWSKTQSTVCLSSGESELRGIADGLAQAIGIQSIAKDLGLNWSIEMFSDATAAIGIVSREGLGKVRHLAVADLWVQQKSRQGAMRYIKLSGKDNPADLMTKCLDEQTMLRHMRRLGIFTREGRATTAPCRVRQ